jgi:hypothetical protein
VQPKSRCFVITSSQTKCVSTPLKVGIGELLSTKSGTELPFNICKRDATQLKGHDHRNNTSWWNAKQREEQPRARESDSKPTL